MSGKFGFFLYICVFLLFAILNILLTIVEPDLRYRLLMENGPIELFSALMYFVCFFLLIIGDDRKRFRYVIIIFLFLGFRELDFHNRFTEISLTSTKFFFSPEVSFFAKAVGILLAFFFLFSIFRVIKSHFSNLYGAIKGKKLYALGVPFGIFLMICSILIDGLQRKLGSFSISADEFIIDFAKGLEETMELAIPMFFFLSIVFYLSKPD